MGFCLILKHCVRVYPLAVWPEGLYAPSTPTHPGGYPHALRRGDQVNIILWGSNISYLLKGSLAWKSVCRQTSELPDPISFSIRSWRTPITTPHTVSLCGSSSFLNPSPAPLTTSKHRWQWQLAPLTWLITGSNAQNTLMGRDVEVFSSCPS